MSIDPSIWSKLHGAATHFPIALIMVSALCDAAGLWAPLAQWRRGLRFTSSLTILLGALGSYAAVLTGLVMARWEVWGHGALLRHHQFVWPAFALMTGLATWRVAARGAGGRLASITYLVLIFIAAALMGGAGYWGGELVNGG